MRDETRPPCLVCLDTEDTHGPKLQIACGHVLHFDCLGEWVVRNPSCPACRAAFRGVYVGDADNYALAVAEIERRADALLDDFQDIERRKRDLADAEKRFLKETGKLVLLAGGCGATANSGGRRV